MPPPGSRGAKAAAAMRRRSSGDHTTGETKTASMNLGATLFAYKGNTCVKRVVIIEEGQHVRISAADVRTFDVGEKVNACVEIKQ